jgi:uncharacterized iron-regulated protein
MSGNAESKKSDFLTPDKGCIMRILRFGLVVFLCSLSMAPRAATADGYTDRDHVLVNKIWNVRERQFVALEQLIAVLRGTRMVLLGETHDNKMHHEQQGTLIRELLLAGRRPVVAFEMLTSLQLGQLSELPASVDAFFDAVAWDGSGWPDREYYRPLFAPVIAAGLPLRAANLERQRLREMLSAGESSLPLDLQSQLARVSFSAEAAASLRKEIADSHCGVLPEQHVAALSLGQRLRDAVMAEALLRVEDKDGVVLVAGNGHIRDDRGVPAYLAAEASAKSWVAVASQEVHSDLQEPDAYAAMWGVAGLPFDYMWFTPSRARPDPCEAFRRHMRESAVNGDRK